MNATTEKPLTNAEKDALVKIGDAEETVDDDGPTIRYGMAWSNVDRVMSAASFFKVTNRGLMAEGRAPDMFWLLTDAGKAVVAEHKKAMAAKRIKRSRAGKARNAAMTGVGMRRTAHGWE